MRILIALVLVGLTWRPLAGASAGAPASLTPQASATGAVSCLSLLTDAEVAAAMGRPATGRVNVSPSGSSQCRWEWPGNEASVTASFSDEAAIRASAAATKCCPNASASAVVQFFDHSVRLEQDLGSDLPVPLTGLGQRAVLFFDDAFLKFIVQRPDGVVQLTGAHVTREQLLALARAMVP